MDSNEKPITKVEKKPGAWHLADNKDLYEVQRVNNFRINITLSDNSEIKNKNAAIEVFSVALRSFTPPSYSQNPIYVSRGNTKIIYAGRMDVAGSMDLVFEDYIGADTYGQLMELQQEAGNLGTERVFDSKRYKHTVTVEELTPDYDKTVRTYTLTGCWFTNVRQSELNQEGTDKSSVTATMYYDWFDVASGEATINDTITYKG
jgi:hypothetical protein